MKEIKTTIKSLINKATLSERLLIQEVLNVSREANGDLLKPQKKLEWEEKRLDHMAKWFGDYLMRHVERFPETKYELKRSMDFELDAFLLNNPEP